MMPTLRKLVTPPALHSPAALGFITIIRPIALGASGLCTFYVELRNELLLPPEMLLLGIEKPLITYPWVFIEPYPFGRTYHPTEPAFSLHFRP
jgi:hypothetical protein